MTQSQNYQAYIFGAFLASSLLAVIVSSILIAS